MNHIANRDLVLQRLKEELVGPAPIGQPIDCSVPIVFATKQESYGPWRQADTGEEILQRDPPYQRYGVGVLSPLRHELRVVRPSATDDASQDDAYHDELETIAGTVVDPDDIGQQPEVIDTHQRVEHLNRVANRMYGTGAGEETDDQVLSTANAHKPSSMALSFLADVTDATLFEIEATGGRYREITVTVDGRSRSWWLRSPVMLRVPVSGRELRDQSRLIPAAVKQQNSDGLDLRIEVFARPIGAHPTQRLITVCLVNRTPEGGTSSQRLNTNETILFQSRFRVTVTTASGVSAILPYPETPAAQLDDEEESLALLYRNWRTFAVGHGCAADWSLESDDRPRWVGAECFPVVEVPSITPDIRREDGSPLTVPMRPLAGLEPDDDGMAALEEVITRYDAWIDGERVTAEALPDRYRAAATRHLDHCARAASRMRGGLRFLRDDPLAALAFRLANHAMLLQQTRSRRTSREAAYDAKLRRLSFNEPAPELYPTSDRGSWRPFQIAFLLATIESAARGDSVDRRTVELIWFPTGGGKTEAYLGLTAFAIFLRRLRDPRDRGTHAIMRYTLRLLTAQQFQRAAGLICAMEYLRRQHERQLGSDELSIGIWLGGETTPNRRSQALACLKDLSKGLPYARNQFLITRCPWCGAQMGPVELERGNSSSSVPKCLGYKQQGDTVSLCCPDRLCEFRDGLPVHVIDEDIYDGRPSLVIGTVDKFAMLAWQPAARAIFGIAQDGSRDGSPPGLIIQDELHLISGPLGSMVGLYETVIEELCTDRRGATPVPPKVVSSTATIRRYKEQIKALYARNDVVLFPPPGLNAADSFFARYARTDDGTLARGRIFVGVHAPGLGSMQTTQTRTFAALMQAPVRMPDAERDPWWTMLAFFNSLRELGTALSLFQSRVPDYLSAIKARTGVADWKDIRRPDRIKELTSRLRSDEVPAAIAELEIGCGGSRRPIDACLSSNIIEVGVDIDRLSLMTVVGQPKTTSQYIQVTGRVGRSWWERPGLIVSLLNPSRPRDRSHFERFRSYHQRLYAQVEPTSVTPFSPPALDRALHAVLICYARQLGDDDVVKSPTPFPAELIAHAERLLLDRADAVDPNERDALRTLLTRRSKEWRNWGHREWGGWDMSSDVEVALMYPAGSWIDEAHKSHSWATPMSMRSVDAECQAEISRMYIPDAMTDPDDEEEIHAAL